MHRKIPSSFQVEASPIPEGIVAPVHLLAFFHGSNIMCESTECDNDETAELHRIVESSEPSSLGPSFDSSKINLSTGRHVKDFERENSNEIPNYIPYLGLVPTYEDDDDPLASSTRTQPGPGYKLPKALLKGEQNPHRYKLKCSHNFSLNRVL